MRRLLLAFALLVASLGATSFVDPAVAQAKKDWTRTTVATADGGIRVGDPNAPVKVVEFVSLTCGHCGAFAETGVPALMREYVQSGRASFELRPHPLDVVAATAAQLARCGTPAQGLALNHDFLTTQAAWFPRLDALTEAQIAQIDRAPPARQRQLIADALGFGEIASRHGMTPAQVRRCLADERGAGRLAAIKRAGEAKGVNATPSFAVNGRLAENVHDWTALEPLLKAQ